MKKEIKITFVENLGITPARVNRHTGEILLNSRVWNKLPEGFQKFILAHEEGHYVLQTTSEIEADNYAFQKLAGTFKNSLKTCVATLADVLPFTSDSHTLRLLNMYRLALLYQANKYGDQPTIKELERIEKIIKNNEMKNSNFTSPYEFQGYSEDLFKPSVGMWFRDVGTSGAATTTATKPNQGATIPVAPVSIHQGTALPTSASSSGKVLLQEIPDYTVQTITLDVKNILIAALAIVVFILLIR